MAKTNKTMKGIFSKGNYWYARIDGREIYCGKGDDGRKIAEAAKAKDIAKRYENKEISAGLKIKRIEFKTVLDMMNWYMQDLPSIQEQKSYGRKVRACKYLSKYFGKMPVNQVEADDIERYRTHRQTQGAASGTIDLEIEYFRAMFKTAARRKKIPADAMPGEFVLKKETNPRRIITDDEVKRLLENSNGDFRDFLICAYESAMRESEISNLTASQVKLDIQHISGEKTSYIDLGIFDTKNGARRTVPVGKRLKTVLRRRLEGLEPDELVFTYEGKKFYNSLIQYKLKAACEKSDIPYGDKTLNTKGERIGIVLHCFRHTRTTKWVVAGFSDEIVRRATGHKDLDAYRTYIKLDPHAVMRLVDDNDLETRQKRDKISVMPLK